MLTELQERIEEIHQREHLAILLKQINLIVKVTCEETEGYLVFTAGTVEFYQQFQGHKIDAEMLASSEVWFNILTGSLSVREAVKRDLLELQSSFRTSLLLDSFFRLITPYDRVV